MSVSQAAKKYKVSRPSIYNWLKKTGRELEEPAPETNAIVANEYTKKLSATNVEQYVEIEVLRFKVKTLMNIINDIFAVGDAP